MFECTSTHKNTFCYHTDNRGKFYFKNLKMTLNKFNKLTFKSENLVVDYITFKFQDLDNLHQTKITNYLFKLGFHSYQQSGKLTQPIKESLRFNSKNKFEVSFVIDNSY